MIAVGTLIVLALLAGFVVAALLLVASYNGLVRLRNETKNSWSQIDVQLKRRHDLIPNLVETVRGYAAHERNTLEAVVKARQQAVEIGGDLADRARAENMLSQTLRSLFAVAESYPELKANQNFLALQEELTATENRISFARQYYNDSVLRYNNRSQTFPTNLVVGLFHFEPAQFFEVDTAAVREAPQVSFR